MDFSKKKLFILIIANILAVNKFAALVLKWSNIGFHIYFHDLLDIFFIYNVLQKFSLQSKMVPIFIYLSY